ncbi:MAG: preprotein translocase subunit YajC [Bacillaceae bacterium]|jgi:preprotein translocase subunit YajC|uniref:Preprotein translocase subunit YajC n=2 Tax=Aeribacillus TaxID=1055323 RepID=A0A161Y3I3_9BACI|nr:MULTISPECIES: preprotein translocase subunit YajC [Aeribacillus]AXI40208.1 preprotein translocase subunit YajC [Bacillaceae bacterium ZC4]REJ21387.1 MAG: preprotein translocase subunit YajC [Bacillaceae bacterium]ASS92025.1 preprotein translocase subunit YajC [Aeribacillus pallidus]KZM54857.1 preprotein translocase subunit YajC [Aeribacillus pallidus]KZN96212.1 preprotein translocase subunit YajC [Aeribacillus pallidus]
MSENFVATVLPFVLMIAIFYFLLIRPQQKRQKQIRDMQANLKKGDKIVTIGGLHGTVDSLDEDKIVIRTGDGSRLTFDRNAVREVVEQS